MLLPSTKAQRAARSAAPYLCQPPALRAQQLYQRQAQLQALAGRQPRITGKLSRSCDEVGCQHLCKAERDGMAGAAVQLAKEAKACQLRLPIAVAVPCI